MKNTYWLMLLSAALGAVSTAFLMWCTAPELAVADCPTVEQQPAAPPTVKSSLTNLFAALFVAPAPDQPEPEVEPNKPKRPPVMSDEAMQAEAEKRNEAHKTGEYRARREEETLYWLERFDTELAPLINEDFDGGDLYKTMSYYEAEELLQGWNCLKRGEDNTESREWRAFMSYRENEMSIWALSEICS